MYQFRIRLYPELQKTRENLYLDSSIEDVKKIAKSYNCSGEKAANKKKIQIETIQIENGDTIQFVLESEAWLQFPTKAVRGFISKLSKVKPYCDLITENGRLFKGESENLEVTKDTINSDIKENLTDEEALIEVTRLFFRETADNRNKIQLIKRILGGEMDV